MILLVELRFSSARMIEPRVQLLEVPATVPSVAETPTHRQ